MRTFLLIMFEVAVLFGIPRMINEIRAALWGASPPVVTISLAEESHSPAVAGTKAALAVGVERAQLLQISPQPAARTVANLQPPPPQAHGQAKENPVEASAAATRNDDYLPPWMRREGAAPPDPNPAGRVLAPVAVKKAATAKQAGHKRRRGERGRATYASRSRRAWKDALGF